MKNHKRNNLPGPLLLTTAAVIWGTSFVAQRIGMNYVGPFTFTATRFFIGALTLLIIIYFNDKFFASAKKVEFKDKGVMDSGVKNTGGKDKALIYGGILCGIALFFGVNLQQIGIQYTTAGKAGFITALYIVLVPLLGLLFKRKLSKRIWLGVFLSLVGLYFLTVKESLSIDKGDFIVLTSTLFWAIHILIIDHYSPKTDGFKLSLIQFSVASLLSGVVAIFTENVNFSVAALSYPPIIYSGVIVVGIAYTLQVLGQKNTNPAVAAIIMSMESVFAVISGMIILHEIMTPREIFGSVLMFLAVIFTTLFSE